MNYYKIRLLHLFIGVAICGHTNSKSSGCSSGRSTSNHIENWNRISQVSESQNPTNIINMKVLMMVPPDETTIKDKVEIEVYYETLCPFSVNFFVSQLKPTVEKLGSHLDIHLIPYGHAKTRRVSGGYYKFSCQHGIPECHGNTVQACAIDVLRNTTRAIYFNTCLMQYTSYQSDYQQFVGVFRWCGFQEKVKVYDIWECVNSKRGSVLLKEYGDETHALAPSYVPYLMIDGSSEYQDQASSDLLALVCRMLKPMPKECEML